MNIEFAILDYIQNNLRTPIGDTIMPLVSNLGNYGVIWIILVIILFIRADTRKIGGIVLLSLGIDMILCNGILKPLIARARPCDINTAIQLMIPRPDDFSFPSGHTAASFAAAFSLYIAGVKKLSIPAFILASFIAFSRMHLYVHFPTDIVAGIVIGILCGYTGYLLMEVITLWKIKVKKSF